MTDRELFDLIMSRWVKYCSSEGLRNEIPLTKETIEGRLVDFKGDVPQSSAFKFDTVGPRVDKLNRVFIHENERIANFLLSKLKPHQQQYLKLEKWIEHGVKLDRDQVERFVSQFSEFDTRVLLSEKVKLTQEHIAFIYFDMKLETYRTARKRAKAMLMIYAREIYPTSERVCA